MSSLVVTGEARRTAATTPTTAQRMTAATAHVMARRLLIESVLLLQSRISQRDFFAGTHAPGDHDLVTALFSDLNGALLKFGSPPHVSHILAGLLKHCLRRYGDGVRHPRSEEHTSELQSRRDL